MSKQALTHNDLIAGFNAMVGHGTLKNFELVGYHAGRFDQPIQASIRSTMSSRVYLVDVHRDGTLGPLPTTN